TEKAVYGHPCSMPVSGTVVMVPSLARSAAVSVYRRALSILLVIEDWWCDLVVRPIRDIPHATRSAAPVLIVQETGDIRVIMDERTHVWIIVQLPRERSVILQEAVKSLSIRFGVHPSRRLGPTVLLAVVVIVTTTSHKLRITLCEFARLVLPSDGSASVFCGLVLRLTVSREGLADCEEDHVGEFTLKEYPSCTSEEYPPDER